MTGEPAARSRTKMITRGMAGAMKIVKDESGYGPEHRPASEAIVTGMFSYTLGGKISATRGARFNRPTPLGFVDVLIVRITANAP